MSLYERILNDTVTEVFLNQLVTENPGAINAVDKKMTPLSAAVMRGQAATVRLLLEFGADVNQRASLQRTPLCFAAGKCTRNRAEIVRLLLEAGADAGLRDNEGTSPLMAVIREFEDVEVAALLVDHGPPLSGQDKAEVLKGVNNPSIIEALQPKSARVTSQSGVIDWIVATLVFVIAWVNENLIQRGADLMRKGLYRLNRPTQSHIATQVITPEPDDFERDIPDEQKMADSFQTNVEQYLDNEGLDYFFAADNPLLHTVVQRAVALGKDSTTSLGEQGNIERLIQLSLYQPILFCDDSGSMKGRRFEDQKDLVERITRITTRLVPDELGVGLYFINRATDRSEALQAADIHSLMTGWTPSGATKIGTNLKANILKPLLYDRVAKGDKLERPLLISILTDGCPFGEPEEAFVQAIIECSEFLNEHDYPKFAVRFQISQVGNDVEAKNFLLRLQNESQIEDMIHCTSGSLDQSLQKWHNNERELEQWLLTTLMEPITRRKGD
ncbi:hypothetical protein BJX65DRAFT_279997 [Aspergillus insuetus]